MLVEAVLVETVLVEAMLVGFVLVEIAVGICSVSGSTREEGSEAVEFSTRFSTLGWVCEGRESLPVTLWATFLLSVT
jgi:hypothetical protein